LLGLLAEKVSLQRCNYNFLKVYNKGKNVVPEV